MCKIKAPLNIFRHCKKKELFDHPFIAGPLNGRRKKVIEITGAIRPSDNNEVCFFFHLFERDILLLAEFLRLKKNYHLTFAGHAGYRLL